VKPNLGLGSFITGKRLFTAVCFPLSTQRGQKVISLSRYLVITLEGIAGQDRRRGERSTEVHKDGPRGEDNVAVTLSVHRGPVPLTEEAGLTVTEALVLLLVGSGWANGLPHFPPPLQPLALLGLQLGLGSYSGGLQDGLLPQVPGTGGPDGRLFLVHLS